MASTTQEKLFGDTYIIRQPRTGYRYTIDSLLLAHFISPEPGQSLVDLGTGSGIIPILLLHRYPTLSVWGVEIQDRLADLAHQNIRDNGLEPSVTILHGDLTRPGDLPLPANLDWVVSNPPYTALPAGRLNPASEKAIARHEVHMTLEQLIRTAAEILTINGRFALIYPVSRLAELLGLLSRSGLAPRTLRMVHPLSRRPARRVLVEAVKGNETPVTLRPPLILQDPAGHPSDEVKRMFE